MMKIFRSELYRKDKNIEINTKMEALEGWATKIDGMKVINNKCCDFFIKDNWCEETNKSVKFQNAIKNRNKKIKILDNSLFGSGNFIQVKSLLDYIINSNISDGEYEKYIESDYEVEE